MGSANPFVTSGDLSTMSSESHGIHVVLASDDGYAHAVATTARSIAEHTSSRVLISVLSDGISKENEQKILASVPHQNIEIEFIPIDLAKSLPGFRNSGRITRSTYSRLLIPELFKDETKVIYSDVDIIFTGDIKGLHDEHLDGHVIGAVPEDFHSSSEAEDFQTRLELPENHTYFCAGILLIDCKAWNQQRTSDTVTSTEKKFRNKLTMADQDLLNIVFQGNYKKLPKKFNVINQISKEFYVQGNPEEIVVRHFNGNLKPWISKPCRLYGSEHYWDTVSRTEFYPEILQKTKKLSLTRRISWQIKLSTLPLRRLFSQPH